MELTFEQIDGYWVSEFEVSADFNLHIERDTEGRLDIYQRTAGGRYEYINDIGYLEKRLVYDYDFSALVYPKFIKIKSKVKPLICTITTDGEVNELKYQEKTLEITSNGTTKVTADTGYNALASVNVKVNVPTEGGGSVTEDDVLWMNSFYVGFPYLNVSKGMGIDYITGEYIPLSRDTIVGFSSSFSDGYAMSGGAGLMDISVSNKSAPKINVKEDEYGNTGLEGGMFTGITIEGELENGDGSKEMIRGRLVEGLNGVNYGWLLYLTDKQDYFHNVYYDTEGYYPYIKITKFIASNGNEVIVSE